MQGQTQVRSNRAAAEIVENPGADKLRRARLSSLFGPMEVATLEELVAEVEWLSCASGETLFREGDDAGDAYLVIRGRLRVAVASGDGGEREVGEAGPGEMVGEMALLSGGERSATVYAVRDGDLARFSRPLFDRLIARHPRLALRLSQLIAERLQRQTTQAYPRGTVSTIAVAPAGPGVELEGFCRDLRRSLGAHGSAARLTSRSVDERLEEPGLAQTPETEAGHHRLVDWLAEEEAAHDYVVYQADAGATAWAERCVRQADHLLIVADAAADPALCDLERCLAGRERAPRRSLVLQQRDEPTGTARWLTGRELDGHYHVRPGRDADLGRLARILTGNGVGLVLSGGGARGLAHVGVIQALEERGIPIDLVGGTSMGALVAALCALGLSAGEMRRHLARAVGSLKDYTFPAVALFEGRKIRGHCHSLFGERALEDLWLPCFAVSTNLSRAEQVVHRAGRIVDAIHASIALPGILPPARQGDDLLVDGGLLNNVPVDVMREICGDSRVIAVDVGKTVELQADSHLGVELSGWKLLWSRLAPRAAAPAIPGIFHLLQRAMLVGSAAARNRTRDLADLYLEPALDGHGLLDFNALDEIAGEGHRTAAARLEDWHRGAMRSSTSS